MFFTLETWNLVWKVRDVFFLIKGSSAFSSSPLHLNCDLELAVEGCQWPLSNVMPLKHVEEQMVCFPSKSVGLYVLGLCLARWQCQVTLLNLLACSHLKPVWAYNKNCSKCECLSLPQMSPQHGGRMGDNTWWCWDIWAGEQWGWYLFVVGAQQMEPFRPGLVEFFYGLGRHGGWGVRMAGIFTDPVAKRSRLIHEFETPFMLWWVCGHEHKPLLQAMIPIFGRWNTSMAMG